MKECRMSPKILQNWVCYLDLEEVAPIDMVMMIVQNKLGLSCAKRRCA